MIFGTNSNYMLKYQKAKAKLVEYDISQKDYPKFPLNSNELSYPVIYILSRYAESIIENDETGKAEFAPYMVKASQYFDASVGANDRTAYDTDFLLSGAAAYFLSNDFGSSKVLCAALFEKIKDTPTMGTSQIILRNLLGYVQRRPSQSVKKYLMIVFWLILLQNKLERSRLTPIISSML